MVFWIILLARQQLWGGLAIGTVGFSVILCGIAAYMVIAVKEIRLNQRQANFVDSVTHELKSPIATLRLYLETLQMRQIEEPQRAHFYEVMEGEVQRLSSLINQLLEVGRLDAIGHRSRAGRRAARAAAAALREVGQRHHKRDESQVFSFDIEPAVVHARPMVLEMIFGNLLDNAIKYGAAEPAVDVQVRIAKRGRDRDPRLRQRQRRSGQPAEKNLQDVLPRRERARADAEGNGAGTVHRPHAGPSCSKGRSPSATAKEEREACSR